MAITFTPLIDEHRRMSDIHGSLTLSPIQQTLQGVCEHLEDDDPQPESILITAGNITMSMKSIDDLLQWSDTIRDFFEEDPGTGAPITFVAQRLWKQTEDQASPTVITLEYDWEFEGDHTASVRLVASSPHTMDQLADADTDDRIGVTRSQVETLMLQGHARKAGLQ